ncbi:hypothetical protein [Vibrio comitans]|uniref:hypothetical protein n=1 Tax=Vibrio comitans TaxID=413401 RepID=UPI00114447A1|nr:hypothetical protein [Vibrio comitans]
MEDTRMEHHSMMTDCDSSGGSPLKASDTVHKSVDCFGQEHCGYTCCQSAGGNPLSFSGSEAREATHSASLSPFNTYQNEPQRGVSNSLYRPPIS